MGLDLVTLTGGGVSLCCSCLMGLCWPAEDVSNADGDNYVATCGYVSWGPGVTNALATSRN